MAGTLIDMLDSHLENCKKYANSYYVRRTYFDQAFGMVTMFCTLCPESEEKAILLWERYYRPQFENILWNERA